MLTNKRNIKWQLYQIIISGKVFRKPKTLPSQINKIWKKSEQCIEDWDLQQPR